MGYKISVIMPALNEEGNIHSAITDVTRALEKYGVSGEIIVINDGSTDKTGEVVSAMMTTRPFIRMLTHVSPAGIGGGFWEGVKVAQGEIVTLIPGDGEVICEEVIRYLPLMDHVDILVPFVYNREVRTGTRRFISKLYKGIINISFGLLLNYMNGPVVYRRSILSDVELRSKGFFYQTELLIKTITRGYLFAEIPCAIRSRLHGKSTALKPKNFAIVIKGYLSMMVAIHLFDRARGPIQSDSVTYARRSGLGTSRAAAEKRGA